MVKKIVKHTIQRICNILTRWLSSFLFLSYVQFSPLIFRMSTHCVLGNRKSYTSEESPRLKTNGRLKSTVDRPTKFSSTPVRGQIFPSEHNPKTLGYLEKACLPILIFTHKVFAKVCPNIIIGQPGLP